MPAKQQARVYSFLKRPRTASSEPEAIQIFLDCNRTINDCVTVLLQSRKMFIVSGAICLSCPSSGMSSRCFALAKKHVYRLLKEHRITRFR